MYLNVDIKMSVYLPENFLKNLHSVIFKTIYK